VHSPTPARPEVLLLTAWLLLLLHRHTTHGYELAGLLGGERIGADPSAVYRALRRLERDGNVASQWAQPVAGPRRRVYRLTTGGRAALDELAARITTARDLNDTFLQALAATRGHTSAARSRA
jgi:PadR family transcriptional regulator PadR